QQRVDVGRNEDSDEQSGTPPHDIFATHLLEHVDVTHQRRERKSDHEGYGVSREPPSRLSEIPYHETGEPTQSVEGFTEAVEETRGAVLRDSARCCRIAESEKPSAVQTRHKPKPYCLLLHDEPFFGLDGQEYC